MKRKVSISTTIALCLLSAALTVSITMMLAMRHFNDQLQQVSERQVEYEHIHVVDKQVREYYTPDMVKLNQNITKGFVEGLGDPYAAYFTADKYKLEKARLSGKDSTIGITLCKNGAGHPTVGVADPNGAGYKNGLRVGDIITTINGESVEGKTIERLQVLLNSTEPVALAINVLRDGESQAYNPTPSSYTITSVEGELLDDVGYIKITAFYKNTLSQLKKMMTELQKKGATSFVFDLRNNQGGNQDAALNILNYIMPVGSYAKMVDVKGNETTLTNANNSQMNLSTVTLVNKNTAGEAELFAGVLQDFGLTTVVGEVTAGKAKYQSYFEVETDSSVLKLTTGEYRLLKTGKAWQDVGIQPNLIAELPKEQGDIAMLVPIREDVQIKAALKALQDPQPEQPDSTTKPEETDKTEEKETASKEVVEPTKKVIKKTGKSTKTTKKAD